MENEDINPDLKENLIKMMEMGFTNFNKNMIDL